MARDLNQVLDDIGMGSYHFVQLLLIGGVMISDGAEILLCSSILGALKTEWAMGSMMRGLMMSLIFVGVFLGGLLGGQIGDTYGRRRAILCSYAGIIIFGTSTAAAQGPISMLILRFFFGASFGLGMGPGVTQMVETAPSSWRAHIINLGGLWFTTGEVYTSVLLIIFMPDLTDHDGSQWRWVTLLSMVPGLLLFPFTYLLLQESPHYLLTNGRHTEAVHSVQYIATMNHQADKVEGLDGSDPDRQLALPTPEDAGDASETLEDAGQASLLAKRGSRSSVGSSSSSSARNIERGEAEVQRSSKTLSVKESMQVLFSADYRGIVFGGCYLCFLCNFLFYGLTYALPQIFESLGHELSPSVQVLIISICDLPGVLLAFFLIYSKSMGHRDGLVMLSALSSVLALTLISIDHGEDGLYVGLPSAYLIKYIASAFFTLTYVYLSEVFPSKVRASGLSLCIAAGRVGSIVSPLIVESLHEKGFKLGEHAPFLILTSVLCLLAIFMIKFLLHFELKNAPLQDAPPVPAAALEGAKDNESRRPSKVPLDPDMPAPAG